MKQETKELIEWIKNACVNYATINCCQGISDEACDFLEGLTAIDNKFGVKIPDTLKEALINDEAEFSVHYCYNHHLGMIEKTLRIRKFRGNEYQDFGINGKTLENLEESICTFLS